MSRRRNLPQRKIYDDDSGFLQRILPLAVIAAVVIVFGGVLYSNIKSHGIDSQTNCPKKLPGLTVMLLDISDQPSVSQQASFDSEMKNISSASFTRNLPLLEKGEKLIVYSVTEEDKPEIIYDGPCHPGDINNRSILENISEGEKFAQQRWEKFSKEISEKVTARFQSDSELRKSPILESIKFIRDKHFRHPLSSDNSKNYKLVIWSDMLQNTDKVSHFNGLEEVKSVRDKYPIKLNNVDVIIFYLTSEKYHQQQGNEHFHWWRKFISLTGGNLRTPEKI